MFCLQPLPQGFQCVNLFLVSDVRKDSKQQNPICFFVAKIWYNNNADQTMNKISKTKKYLFFFGVGFAFFAISSSAFAATNVYYSVGQNTTTHETGAGTVTVSGTTATFSVAQTATNMGVGDVIDYDTDNKKCYISGKTSTTVWSCTNATGGTPTAATDVTVNSITHAFSSLSAALPSGSGGAKTLLGNADLTAIDVQLNIPCYYDTGADTTAVDIGGWTTDTTRYVKIYTPTDVATEANRNQRHTGKWDEDKFRLDITSGEPAVNVGSYYVRIVGLQVRNNLTAPSQHAISNGDGGHNMLLDSLYIEQKPMNPESFDPEFGDGVYLYRFYSGTVRNCIIASSIVYNGVSSASGIYSDSPYSAVEHKIQNNTIEGFAYGIYADAFYDSGTLDIVNNLVANSVYEDNFAIFFEGPGTRDYNASDDATSTGGSNDQTNQTFSFLDASRKDLHLKSSDIGARNLGTNLNSVFSLDIDGQNRPAGSYVWDIGADEVVDAVYYSVGQNSSNHCGPDGDGNSCGNVSISSGTATFTAAQAGTNLGVGDRLTAGGNVYYLAQKTDTTHWTVVDKLGAVPADLASTAVTSIAHEYTSLSAAEAGATDSNHLNTTDLVAGNYQLNFPCYYDTGADTTAVTIDGWTTGESNYIKIYTPIGTDDSNSSQRHSGLWSATKYNLSPATGIPLTLSDENVRTEGLEIYSTNDHGIYVNGATASSNVYLSNNIIKGNATSSKYGIDLVSTGATSKSYIYNNIAYDYSGTTAIGLYQNDADWTTYFYNNTLSGNTQGINNNAGAMIAKNNLVTGSGNTNTYIGTFTTGTDYNATDGTDDIGTGSNNRVSQTFSFVDSANKDFHLKTTDTGAKDYGTSLCADSNLPVTHDIDGEQRVCDPNKFDIGADETTGLPPSAGGGGVISLGRNMSLGRNVSLKVGACHGSFGNTSTTDAGMYGEGTAGQCILTRVTDACSVTTSSIVLRSSYLDPTPGSNARASVVIYSDNSGSPGTLLNHAVYTGPAFYDDVAPATSATVDISAITGATTFWIGYCSEVASAIWHSAATGGTSRYYYNCPSDVYVNPPASVSDSCTLDTDMDNYRPEFYVTFP